MNRLFIWLKLLHYSWAQGTIFSSIFYGVLAHTRICSPYITPCELRYTGVAHTSIYWIYWQAIPKMAQPLHTFHLGCRFMSCHYLISFVDGRCHHPTIIFNNLSHIELAVDCKEVLLLIVVINIFLFFMMFLQFACLLNKILDRNKGQYNNKNMTLMWLSYNLSFHHEFCIEAIGFVAFFPPSLPPPFIDFCILIDRLGMW